MATPFPESYKDGLYASLDAGMEKKHDLPTGMLSSIRTQGERTNASRVSEAGAKTPYQFIPATRDAVVKKYGIDPYLSPENASEAAALLLKESLKRNKGDEEMAVREYHGGTNRNAWGKVNDAYWSRVSSGLQTAKLDKLGADFGAWLKANPATPPKAQEPAAKQPSADPLVEDFGRWLASGQKSGQKSGADLIPGQAPGVVAPAATWAPTPDTSGAGFGDQLLGLGEAGLTAATGMTGGALGMAGGTVKGVAQQLMNGQFGTPQGANAIEQAAAEGAQALTYQPRTAVGQVRAGQLGEAMQAAIPVMPMTAELATLGRAAAPAGMAARTGAAAVLNKAATAAPAAVQKVAAVPGRIVDAVVGVGAEGPRKPTAGTMGSVGSAGTDMAAQRIATAENLGFQADSALTKGQATRSFEDMRFEKETAKDPVRGAQLRERADNQNAQLQNTLEGWINDTGAQSLDNVQTGRASVDALTKMKASDKVKVRSLYKEAEKAGEMESPVATDGLASFLNENRVGETTAPVLKVARDELVRLGGATLDEAGNIIPGELSLKNLDFVRKAVNKFTKTEGPDMLMASGIRGAMDTMTEGVGGNKYQAARKAHMDLLNKYEKHAVVADLLANRKKMLDPKVAAENVFDRVILKGSQDDVGYMQKLLRSGGEDGQQAWAELHGATLRYLRDQALANNATDQAGRTVFSSAKFEQAMKKLDANGRLDIVLGKQGAQQVRDLNEVAKFVNTAPPGAINTSNTASVLLAALTEAGVTGSMTGLPLPVLSGLRAAVMHVKDRRIQQRVQSALRNETLRQQRNAKAMPPVKPTKTFH